METRIVMIVLVIINALGANQVLAQAHETDCARLKKLLDQYAHVLFLNAPNKDGRPVEVREKELLRKLHQLNLPEGTKAKARSLLKSIRQCYGFAGSAAYGMTGFLTDLRFRMGRDERLRENCSEIEGNYKKLLQRCGAN